MKSFNKKIIFSSLITGIFATLFIGGISASADELGTQKQTVDYNTVTSKVRTVYNKTLNFSRVTVDQSDFENLENEPKELTLEQCIVNGIKEFNTQIDISSYQLDKDLDSDILKDTINKIHMEYPELFYIDTKFLTSYSTNTNKLKFLKLTYTKTPEEYAECMNTIDTYFTDFFSTINDDMSDLEKVLLAHDYLCLNFEYDTDLVINDMYEFVVNKKGVCQSYMLTFSYILDKMGINSYPIMSSELQHTWNMVELNGQCYQVDVTWDDFVPELLGWSSHAYFLLSDDLMSYTHKEDWYLYEDLSATDETYNDYYFKETSYPLINTEDGLYCIKKGILCKYDIDTNTITEIADLSSTDKWYNYNSSVKSYFKDKYTSIHKYKDVIIYNTPDKVLATDTSGKLLDILHTRDISENAIYGLAIKDGKVLIQIESNLNVERDDFGQNIVEVCDIEEWYQNFKENPPVFTEETTVTTTEETTITTTTTKETTITTTKTTTTKPKETTVTTIVTTPVVTTTTEPTTTTEVTTTTEPTIITEVTTTTAKKYQLDINGDNELDIADLLNLKSYIIEGNTENISTYDVNHDGKVNILDILIMKDIIINGKE